MVLFFFEKTKVKDYKISNWNAVFFYNYIYNVLSSKNEKIDRKELAKKIVLQYNEKCNIDCTEQINLALSDINQYLKVLKLNSYLKNIVNKRIGVTAKGSLSDDDLELNVDEIWMKDRNGDVSKRGLRIKVETGEPCYECLQYNFSTPCSTYLGGIPMMEVHKLSINKYMQIENSELKEYEFTFNTMRVMHYIQHLIDMLQKETNDEIQIQQLKLNNPLSNTVPIRYVIYGKVNDETVVCQYKKDGKTLPLKIKTFGGPIILQFKETDGAKVKLPKNGNRFFSNCHNLIEIDMSGCDTSQTSSINYMFKNCTGLKKIKGLNKLVTKNNHSLMFDLFAYCSNLTGLDLKDWDTSYVGYIQEMSLGYKQLSKINISNFKLDKIKDMSDIFAYCTSLQSIDFGHLDQSTDSLKTMENMFIGCSSLKTAKLGSLNTSNVEFLDCMFMGCSSPEELELASCPKVGKNHRGHMFRNCGKLPQEIKDKFN